MPGTWLNIKLNQFAHTSLYDHYNKLGFHNDHLMKVLLNNTGYEPFPTIDYQVLTDGNQGYPQKTRPLEVPGAYPRNKFQLIIVDF